MVMRILVENNGNSKSTWWLITVMKIGVLKMLNCPKKMSQCKIIIIKIVLNVGLIFFPSSTFLQSYVFTIITSY